jgi:ectoine hydroxylase-related dioxygenase (phytanoyl-CoA dioxygenase family)
MPAEIPHVDAHQPIRVIVDALDDQGAVIVDGFLDSDLLERFNAELDPLIADLDPDRDFVNPAVAYFFGKQTKHLTAVAAHSKIFSHEILPHPLYEAICNDVLGKGASSVIMNTAHIMDRGPGAERQFLHRDEDVWPHVPKPHPELQLASVIALERFDESNGATCVVPGSHRWPREREATEKEIAIAAMDAGSAVIYLGSAIHAGGANTTSDRRRRGMHVSYCAGWLRTEENQYLSVPIEQIREMPERAQALLGYAAHDAIAIGGGYLGTVDLVDPIDLVKRGQL